MSTLFVPRERAPERRVAATPDSVKQHVSAGLDVVVESGAGEGIRVTDSAYTDVGARITDDRNHWLGAADIVCTVGTPDIDDVARLKRGAVLVGLLAPAWHTDLVRALRDGQVASLAMELVPRITRAQSVDALSSQASIAGYKAVLLAAATMDKQFHLAMTAAGTIRPAKVVIIGAGVAGLQAVATAHRLGAVVEVSDVRAAVKEEVESLGASFIDPPEVQESDDGYAKEVGKDFLTLQREQLTRHIAEAHAVLTTAAIPGRRAPEIITAEMVEAMRPGAVIIDLAAATGGNCALTPSEGEVEHNGVRVIAAPDLAATMPREASGLYARNVLEMVSLVIDEDGAVTLDLDDEIVAGALLTLEGRVRHGPTAELVGEDTNTAAEQDADEIIVIDEDDAADGGDTAETGEAAGAAPASPAAEATAARHAPEREPQHADTSRDADRGGSP